MSIAKFPVEIKCHMLNQFVYFFDPTISKEQRIFQRSATTLNRLHERVLDNITCIVRLSELNREWNEFINHKRMNRLWKSMYFMLCGTYERTMEAHEATLTAIQHFKLQVVMQFERVSQEYTADCIRKAIAECDQLRVQEILERPVALRRLVSDAGKHALYMLSFSNTHSYLVICEVVFHSSYGRDVFSGCPSFEHYIRILLDNKQFFDNFIKMLHDPVLNERIFNLFYNNPRYNNHEIDFCVYAKPDDQKAIKPFLIEYRKKDPKPRLLSRLLEPLLRCNYASSHLFSRLTFFKELGSVDIDYALQSCFRYYVQTSSLNQFVACVNFLIQEFGINPTLKESNNTLHEVLATRIYNVQFYQVAFKNFKSWLGPMLLVKSRHDHILPVQEILRKFSCRSASTLEMRQGLMSIFFDNCPDLKVYKEAHVHTDLMNLIHAVGDDKQIYAKYLRKL